MVSYRENAFRWQHVSASNIPTESYKFVEGNSEPPILDQTVKYSSCFIYRASHHLLKHWGLWSMVQGRFKHTGELFWICTSGLSRGCLKCFYDCKESVVKIFVTNRSTTPKRGKGPLTLISTKNPSYLAPTQLSLPIHSSCTLLRHKAHLWPQQRQGVADVKLTEPWI